MLREHIVYYLPLFIGSLFSWDMSLYLLFPQSQTLPPLTASLFSDWPALTGEFAVVLWALSWEAVNTPLDKTTGMHVPCTENERVGRAREVRGLTCIEYRQINTNNRTMLSIVMGWDVLYSTLTENIWTFPWKYVWHPNPKILWKAMLLFLG